MAEKALFHKTIITTGHGSKICYVPALRKADVINDLQTNSEKVVVESSVWLSVSIMINSCDVYFLTDNDLRFEADCYGFDYLVNQFKPLYQKALHELHGQ